MRLFRIARYGRILYVGPLVVAVSRAGNMGYSTRWRRLAPISTRFKVCLHTCEFCGSRVSKCGCWP